MNKSTISKTAAPVSAPARKQPLSEAAAKHRSRETLKNARCVGCVPLLFRAWTSTESEATGFKLQIQRLPDRAAERPGHVHHAPVVRMRAVDRALSVVGVHAVGRKIHEVLPSLGDKLAV